MTETQVKEPKSLILVWVILVIVILSAFIPAKWLGVKPAVPNRLDLKALTEMGRLTLDQNNNNNPDWKDLLNEVGGIPTATSTIDPIIQKKLDDPNNLTSSFSKNLFIASAYLKQNNITNAEDQQQLVSSMLADEGSKITAKEYIFSDLKISKTENNDSIKKYGNNLADILVKAIKYNLGEGDIKIIESYTINKDTSVLTSLIIKKDRASELLQQLLSMGVPTSASVYHLLAVNNLSAYITTLDNLSRVDTDPVKAMISFKQYNTVTKSLSSSVIKIVNYFRTSNVVFTTKDPGYIFSSGYTK